MDSRCRNEGNCIQPGCDCTCVELKQGDALSCKCGHSPDMHATPLKKGITKSEGYTDDFCGYGRKNSEEIERDLQ
uniref:Uncharacterized protein n=1 Tax=Globodera rostochiensis TaxID=31243 RepID=A0A914I3A4_GLORO